MAAARVRNTSPGAILAVSLSSHAKRGLSAIVASCRPRSDYRTSTLPWSSFMRSISFIAPFAVIVLVAGCGARQIRIAELKDQPTTYNEKAVRITGMVTSSFEIPLVPFQLYNVDD